MQRWIRRSEQEQEQEQQSQTMTTDAVMTAPPRFVEIAHEESVAHDRPGITRWPEAPHARAPRLRLELGDGVILTLY